MCAAGRPSALPLLPQSQTGCWPQLHWRDVLSKNTTTQRHYSGLQGCNPPEKMHYSSWPRTHPSPYEALWPLPMVLLYGLNNRNFPGLDWIFPGKNSTNLRKNPVSSRGTVLLSYWTYPTIGTEIKGTEIKGLVPCGGTRPKVKLQNTLAVMDTTAGGFLWPSRVRRCSLSKIFFASIETLAESCSPRRSVWIAKQKFQERKWLNVRLSFVGTWEGSTWCLMTANWLLDWFQFFWRHFKLHVQLRRVF